MKMLAGIVFATLSMVGFAPQNKVVTPPSSVAVNLPKANLLSAAAPVVVTQSVKSPKPVVAVFRPVAAGIVLGTSTSDGAVTQSELQAAIEQASNALRQLVYANAGTVGQGLYSTGGYTNNIALSQRIDSLSNVTISNATVHGINGLAVADIPDLSSQYLPLSGGTIAGGLTVTGAFSGGSISLNTSSSTNSVSTNATSTNLAVSGVARLASYNGLVDIRFYGAVCDGVTNVAPAVTAAINAGAKKIFLPANCVYQPPVSGGSPMTPANVEIDGEDENTSIISVSDRTTQWLNLGSKSLLKNVGIISLACDQNVVPFGTQKVCPVGGCGKH
jgi:hypothetical protein